MDIDEYRNETEKLISESRYLLGSGRPKLADVALWMRDDLALCKTIAEAVFGEGNATPEFVIAIYDRIRDGYPELEDEKREHDLDPYLIDRLMPD